MMLISDTVLYAFIFLQAGAIYPDLEPCYTLKQLKSLASSESTGIGSREERFTGSTWRNIKG